MTMRFHWRLPQAGEGEGISRSAQAMVADTAMPDLDNQARFALAAEDFIFGTGVHAITQRSTTRTANKAKR